MQAKGKFLIDNDKKILSFGVFFGSPLFFFHMVNMADKGFYYVMPEICEKQTPRLGFCRGGGIISIHFQDCQPEANTEIL